jgi:hypothetical protein
MDMQLRNYQIRNYNKDAQCYRLTKTKVTGDTSSVD